MTDIILHHYDTSPFSEKVRICLGIKGLSWLAVEQPVIMPKPDLIPLTGGYRRIPVLQIGADVFCDSALIVRELEQRFDGRTLYPTGTSGFASAVEQWSDKGLFQSAVTAIFGTLGEHVDPAFVKDREALSGQPFNIAAMKSFVPFALTQITAHAALLGEHLADGRPYLEGEAPGHADAAAYYNYWFVRNFCPGLLDSFDAFPQVDAWINRVASIGHGHRQAMTPAEALEVARKAAPSATEILPADQAFAGKRVSIAAVDYGCEPVVGVFSGSTPTRMTVMRTVDGYGQIAVHMPRLGYKLQLV